MSARTETHAFVRRRRPYRLRHRLAWRHAAGLGPGAASASAAGRRARKQGGHGPCRALACSMGWWRCAPISAASASRKGYSTSPWARPRTCLPSWRKCVNCIPNWPRRRGCCQVFPSGTAVAAQTYAALAEQGDTALPAALMLMGPAVNRFQSHEVQVPDDTLLVHGEEDEVVPLSEAMDWAPSAFHPRGRGARRIALFPRKAAGAAPAGAGPLEGGAGLNQRCGGARRLHQVACFKRPGNPARGQRGLIDCL